MNGLKKMYTHTHTHTHTHMMEYYAGIKEQNSDICSNLDEPRDYHTKWSKSKINIVWYHLFVESKKNDTNELIYKTETDS